MKTKLFYIITIIALVAGISSYASAAPALTSIAPQKLTAAESSLTPVLAPVSTLNASALTGTWINTTSSGIVKVQIMSFYNMLFVRVHGSCTPTPCDWGWVPAVGYAANVSSTKIIAFTAKYDESFVERIVTGHITNGKLVVETYSVFKDGSGRSNYYSSTTLTEE